MESQTPRIGDSPSASWEQAAFPALIPVDIRQQAAAVSDQYKNSVLLDVNTHCVRLAVMAGEYRWHHHPHSDELFMVLEGELEIDLEDGRTVVLKPGQLFNIPAGARHRTRARARTVNLCFEDKAAYADVVFDDDGAPAASGPP